MTKTSNEHSGRPLAALDHGCALPILTVRGSGYLFESDGTL
jgi:hypothetical protein